MDQGKEDAQKFIDSIFGRNVGKGHVKYCQIDKDAIVGLRRRLGCSTSSDRAFFVGMKENVFGGEVLYTESTRAGRRYHVNCDCPAFTEAKRIHATTGVEEGRGAGRPHKEMDAYRIQLKNAKRIMGRRDKQVAELREENQVLREKLRVYTEVNDDMPRVMEGALKRGAHGVYSYQVVVMTLILRSYGVGKESVALSQVAVPAPPPQ